MTPTPYQQIAQRLQQAKKQGIRPEDANHAIICLADAMAKIATDETLSSAILGEFIADEAMLFPTDKEIAISGQADYRIISSGLICQTLSAAGVAEAIPQTKRLQQALYNLAAVLAHKDDGGNERNHLSEALRSLRQAAE